LHAIKALAEYYHRPLSRITERQVRKYLLYLIESKGYAKSTFNIDLNAIKFLYPVHPLVRKDRLPGISFLIPNWKAIQEAVLVQTQGFASIGAATGARSPALSS